VLALICKRLLPARTNSRLPFPTTTSGGCSGKRKESLTDRVAVSKTARKLEVLFAIKAVDPSAEKARFDGPEPTKTVSSSVKVRVLKMATAF
jgi:hypothetical protein